MLKLGAAVFKLYGWDYEIKPDLVGKQQVVIGCKHTSNRDGILAIALFQIIGIKIHTLIKKELFKGPMKPILEAMGGIAVDRKAKGNVVPQMVQYFNENEKFNLVIAPEATRAARGEARRPIRTGFWHIAKAANVPIVCMYANSLTKQGGIFAKIYPSNLDDDLELMQKLYKEHTGLDIVIPKRKTRA